MDTRSLEPPTAAGGHARHAAPMPGDLAADRSMRLLEGILALLSIAAAGLLAALR